MRKEFERIYNLNSSEPTISTTNFKPLMGMIKEQLQQIWGKFKDPLNREKLNNKGKLKLSFKPSTLTCWEPPLKASD